MLGIHPLFIGGLGASIAERWKRHSQRLPSNTGIGYEAVKAIFLDHFDDALLIREAASEAPIIVAFLTNRGAAVSPLIGGTGLVCYCCFRKRWFANLEAWEGSASWLRTVAAVANHIPPLPDLVPDTVVDFILSLVSQRVTDVQSRSLCHYFDLITCDVSVGPVLPVHGCSTCRSALGGPLKDAGRGVPQNTRLKPPQQEP